jgi:hypothetical protein
MKRKSCKKGGGIINGVDNLDQETSTDEPMVNKNEPMANKNEPANNEPKKFVDPNGKEWCECPPPKTSRIESVKNFGNNANDAVKNFQDKTINNITGTFSQKKDELKKNLSDKALNFVGNIFGSKDKVVEANKEMVGGRRRTKHCTRKHTHKHKNKNCTRKHKHKHSKHKHSKHKHSKHKHSKNCKH